MIEDSLWPSPTDAERALPLPTDADGTAWYGGHLSFAIAKQLLDGQHVTGDSNTFYYKPAEPMTRKEVLELAFRTTVYMLERVEYVDLITETACFQKTHADMPEDQAKELWRKEVLGDLTEEEVDQISDKYIKDDVLTLMKADNIEYTCGDSSKVDMTKWDGFKIFAR